MIVVITDLDGTLLDRQTYAFASAIPALNELRSRQIPLVLCTSKTRAETEVYRSRFRNAHPFIVENGGAVFIPTGYFGERVNDVADGYERIELGARYARLIEVLRDAAVESGCEVRGFSHMTPAEIALLTGLSIPEAELAKRREFDEPFTIRTGDFDALRRAINRMGYRATRGGQFFHITGDNDKALAVSRLLGRFRERFGHVQSIGLGDALNDAEFLNAVDVPVLIPSSQLELLRTAVPHGRLADAAGSQGWNRAVLSLLSKIAK